MAEMIVKNLNKALHQALENNPTLYVIGEDISDPYGGAFKVTKGLSTTFSNRIIQTPICENTILGIANGLILTGNKAIAEIMFGDFITLAFDQILNFSSKIVSMFGQKLSVPLIVRCPVGGHRGYGPTHSQSLQKHFIGIPNLRLYEITPFHDNIKLIQTILDDNLPTILFESKILYGKPTLFKQQNINEIYTRKSIDSKNKFQHITSTHFENPQVLVITPGSMSLDCLNATEVLFMEDEIEADLMCPAMLYPLCLEDVAAILQKYDYIFIVEESTAGGTWGTELKHQIYDLDWKHFSKMSAGIQLIHSADSIIPCSKKLEESVLVSESTIYNRIKEVLSL